MPDGGRPGDADANKPVAAEERRNGMPPGPDLAEDPEAPEDEWWTDGEDFGEDGDGEERRPRFPAWVRRLILWLVAIALAGQATAWLPAIYNVNVLRLIAETRELARDERVQAYKAAIVVVEAAGRKGTGFNVAERGLVVTNHHVVEGSRTAVVGFADGRVFRARVLAEDAAADLAVLAPAEPREETYPTLPLASGGTWSPGEPVVYIGNPLFLRHVAGRGTVLGLAHAGKDFPVLLVEAPVYPGNSGSPVIAEDGRVIGILYASTGLDRDGGRVKAGLAIPADHPFLAPFAAGRPDG